MFKLSSEPYGEISMIIVDGSDRTGKSSILYEFTKLTGIPHLHWDGIRNSGIKDLQDPVIAKLSKLTVELVLAFLEIHHDQFISDRGYMSELAYSRFFHRPCLIKQKKIEEQLRKHGVVYIFLHCEQDELRRRFAKVGDMYVSVEQALSIQDIYQTLYYKSIMLKMKIEVAGKTPKEIAKEISNKLMLDGAKKQE
jgi:hypothetical protein